MSGDTIAALATPAGRGAVGVVRLSGPAVPEIAQVLIGCLPAPRQARLARVRDAAGTVLDQVLALYFPAPVSYTGEHVLELQGHGGPAVLAALLRRCLELGARPASSGEFSQRAFLNGKLDLAQAEAVADLIDAGSEAAARAAARSLEGEFSRRVEDLAAELLRLRVRLEGALDFSDQEDVPETDSAAVAQALERLDCRLSATREAAGAGRRLRDGLTVAIAGAPNVGKSSLLNRLAGAERAIVTDVPGTTRDVLREQLEVQGIPLHLLDTAGLRTTDDPVESEGVRRARQALATADLLLLVVDHRRGPQPDDVRLLEQRPRGVAAVLVHNKIDLDAVPAGRREGSLGPEVALSALTGEGLELLCDALVEAAGGLPAAGTFSARQRHLDALERCAAHLAAARDQHAGQAPAELVAEELRLAQRALGEITGELAADDLLGEIFASFCIGK